MDAYDRLAQKMDSFPLGAPEGPALRAVLTALFQPEEAEVVLALSPRPSPLKSLAQGLSRPREEVEKILEGLAGRGLIYARRGEGEAVYSLLPVFPGIFELQFMSGERGTFKTRLARLFETYYVESVPRTFGRTRTSFARVVPVEKEIPVQMEIQPFEQVSALIREGDEFALATCYCRHEKELLGQGCDHPKDVCMLFGPFAHFAVERGFAKKAGRAEMISALVRAEEAGLVHVSDNVRDRINFMCNCCGCCCGFLRTVTQFNLVNVVAASRYVVKFDPDACTACQTCVQTCQIKAASFENDEIRFDQMRCLGCGACVNLCPEGALSLAPRPDFKPPMASLRDLQASLLKDRGLAG